MKKTNCCCQTMNKLLYTPADKTNTSYFVNLLLSLKCSLSCLNGENIIHNTLAFKERLTRTIKNIHQHFPVFFFIKTWIFSKYSLLCTHNYSPTHNSLNAQTHINNHIFILFIKAYYVFKLSFSNHNKLVYRGLVFLRGIQVWFW